MKGAAMFDLEDAIRKWKHGLAENESLEDGAIAEIEAHLRDEIEDFVGQGQSPEDAFQRAVAALGEKRDIGREFLKARRPAPLPRRIRRWIGFRPSLGRNYVTIALRTMVRNKMFSAINVAGLAIGLACCLLIFYWVRDERSFDRFHRHGPNIYRVVADWTQFKWEGLAITPHVLAPAITKQVPGVEKAARFFEMPRRVFRYKSKAFFEDRGIIVDPEFFEIFTFPFFKGDPRTVLRGPSDIVISESLAAKYFGTEDPIGKIIDSEGSAMIVRGVFRDVPRRSTFRFDYALPFNWPQDSNAWNAFAVATYVQTRADADVKAVASRITDVARRNKSSQVMAGARFRLQLLADVHLDAQTFQRETMDLGNGGSVSLFSIIAVFVLVIAGINFVNLSVARAAHRAREVGLRKTIGANRGDLLRQFLGESFILVAAAALAALAVVRLILPAFNRLAGKSLTLNILEPDQMLGTLAVVLIAGLLAGGYPAVVLSAFKPAAVLKGRSATAPGGGTLRKLLVVFQFALSIFLFISSVALFRQFRYMRTAELGYDKDNVVQLTIKENAGKSYAAMKERLLSDPGVTAVTAEAYSFAEYGIHRGGEIWDWEGRERNQSLNDMVLRGVADNFVEAMGLTLTAGRSFVSHQTSDNSRAVILNEKAVAAIGLKDPVGKWFSWQKDQRQTIVGVVKDVHFESLHQKVSPEVFYLSISDSSRASDVGIVLVRIRGDRTTAALAHIRKVWEEFTSVPFEFRFLDETYARLYRTEYQRSCVYTVFAGLAVFIGCLGMLGLTIFVAERRRKEISIRKVIGASTRGILALLSGQITRWVLAANLLAWPAAYFILNKILEKYPYRIRLGLDLFALPTLIVLALAGATVVAQSWRTARMNPVENLRHE
jgi:putative ABC transport system permease protein